MGQQQLLLLVLSTVIVGLATVAGIEAFQENQTQATQDALVQRAINIGNDVLAAHEEPSQFGGVDLINGSPSLTEIARAAGYDDGSSSPETGISADGAGDNAACDMQNLSTGTDSGTVEVVCADDGSGGASDSGSGTNQSVIVTVDASAGTVQTTSINTNSV